MSFRMSTFINLTDHRIQNITELLKFCDKKVMIKLWAKNKRKIRNENFIMQTSPAFMLTMRTIYVQLWTRAIRINWHVHMCNYSWNRDHLPRRTTWRPPRKMEKIRNNGVGKSYKVKHLYEGNWRERWLWKKICCFGNAKTRNKFYQTSEEVNLLHFGSSGTTRPSPE